MTDSTQQDPSYRAALSELNTALQPRPNLTREYLEGLAEAPIKVLDEAREQHRAAGTLTPDLDTFFSTVEREKAEELATRWADDAVDENAVLTEANQLFRSGSLPERYAPLITTVVREKIKASKARGIEPMRILKGVAESAVPVATEMVKSTGENIYTAMGEVPASLAAVALGKLSGDKALEQEGMETGMRAGARVASGAEAETRESAGFLSRGFPRVYDVIKAIALSGGPAGMRPGATGGITDVSLALSGYGDANRMSTLREAALTDDKALDEFVKQRLAEEDKIQAAREFKGEVGKAIGADIDALKAQGYELKPEDAERARLGGVMLDLTEPPLVPFMLGASITGKGLRRVTFNVLKKTGLDKAAEVVARGIPKATPTTRVLGRAIRTAEEVAAEARGYDTAFRKLRVAAGNSLVAAGKKIQQIPLPAGAPVLVAGGVLASGGDMQTAGVAALTTAVGRRVLGSRIGLRATGRGLEAVGRGVGYVPKPTSAWEKARRGYIDLRRDMTAAAAAGVAESSLYAMDPSMSPEAKGAILSSGLAMGPAGAAGAHGMDWLGNGAKFGLRLAVPDSIDGKAALPRAYNTAADQYNVAAFNKLSEDSTIFVRALQEFIGRFAELYIADSPEAFQNIVKESTKDGQNIRADVQGVTLSADTTKSGKPVAVINLGYRGTSEAGGHEVTHAIFQAMLAAGGESAAKVKKLYKTALKSLGGIGSTQFNAVKSGYEEALGRPINNSEALQEWVAEHGSVVLAGLPVGKLGAEKGFVTDIYDALLTFAEAIGARVPGYQQDVGGPVTSQALPYSPSVSLLNALDNMFYAFKVENDAMVPPVEPDAPAAEAPVGAPPVAPAPGAEAAAPAAPAPAPTPVEPVAGGAGILSPIPANLAVDPQSPLKPPGVTGEADITPAAIELLEEVDDGGRPSQRQLDRVAKENDLPAGLTLTALISELNAKRVRAGAVVAPQQSAPAPAPTPQAPPAVGGVTEAQRQQLAGAPSPETQQQNEQVLSQNLGQAHEVVYSSAAEEAPGTPADEQQRLRERQAREALEREGIVNTLSRLYSKIVTPIKVRVAGNGRTIVTGFSVDKFARNMNLVADWLIKRGERAQVERLMSPEFAQEFLKYLENQYNGYRGDGERIVRPEGWDPNLFPAENKNYTPQKISEESRNWINFLMGFDPLSRGVNAEGTVRNAWTHKLAEANGFVVTRSVPGVQGEKVYYNPLNKELADAGFNVPLHKAIEVLRIDRMATVAKVRPDLAAIKPAVTGSVQAGFMPETKEPISTLRGRAQSLRHGAVITDYVKALVAADNATFMKELDATQTSLLKDIADHYQLGVDLWKGSRLGVLSAVRKELAFQRRRAAAAAKNRRVLNIGLRVGETGSITQQQAIDALKAEGINVLRSALGQSTTEPTLIAEIDSSDEAAVARVSEKLGQDAIAMYNPADDSGVLVGPRIENFGGKFIKDYFIPLSEKPEPRAMPAFTEESVNRANPFLRGRIVSGWLLKDGTFKWGRALADHEDLARYLGFKSIEDLRDNNRAVRVWADGEDRVLSFDPDTFAEIPSLQRRALDDLAIEQKAVLRDGRGNIIEDYSEQGERYMPKAKEPKPLKGSLGKGSIKFFHYSDQPNKGAIDPKYFGKSGVTGAGEQAGLSRAFAYAEGSTLGQDAGLIDARKHYYEGSVSKGQIYDGVEDTLGYGDTANRAKADQMLVDKGFIGIYREGLNGVKQLEFFQPMPVTEGVRPEIAGPLAEEALPILPPLELEEIDYAAADREFARRKAAGEELFMPKATEAQEAAFKGSKVRSPDGALRPMFHFTTADFEKFGRGDLGFHFGTPEQAAERGVTITGPWNWESVGLERTRTGSRTIPVFLDIKNPLRLEDPGMWDDPEVVYENIPRKIRQQLPESIKRSIQGYVDFGNEYDGPTDKYDVRRREAATLALLDIQDGLKSLGYDGVVYENKFEDKYTPEDSYIAFDNEQIMPAFAQDAQARFMPAPPVESEAFKAWSGGKRVYRADEVNIENPPRRGVFEVYHGTKEDIAEFKAKYQDGLIFTTTNPEFAAEWGRNRNRDGRSPRNYPKDVEMADKAKAEAIRPTESYEENPGAWEAYFNTPEWREPGKAKIDADTSVMKLYANVEKAFDPRKDYKLVEPLLRTMKGYEGIIEKGNHKQGNWIVYENRAVVDLLKSKGYDAMWLSESVNDPKHETLAVFEPTQIKSATGNIGTFDPTNPDIRYMPGDTYSWMRPDGSVVPVEKTHGVTALKYFKEDTAAEAIETAWSQGWLRVANQGEDLYVHTESGQPNAKQMAELKNLAIENGKSRIVGDFGPDRKVLWTEDDAMFMPEATQEGALANEKLTPANLPLSVPSISALDILYSENPTLKAEGKRDNPEVAAQLKQAAIDKWGRKITSDDITPAEEEEIAQGLAEETREALNREGHAGNWYTKAIKRMLAVGRTMYPELNSEAAAKKAGFPGVKQAELGLTVALAVTSQNLAVPQNAKYADEQFKILRDTGRFDPSRDYGAKASAISGNLELANTLLDLMGWEGLEQFVSKDFTVGELSKKASEILGEKVTIAGRVDDVVQGAAIFGPKIGQGFLQNLLGNLMPVTVDLWLRRTWGRWTGDVRPDGVTAPQLARMVDTFRERGLPLPASLRSVRVVERFGKSKNSKAKRTLTEESAGRILSDQNILKDIADAAEEQFSNWNRMYRELREGITPEQLAAVRDGSLSLEDLNRRQQATIKHRDRQWDKVSDQYRGKNAKEKFLEQLDQREGRTAFLSNDDLSKNKPEWVKAAAVIFNSRKPIDTPTDQDRAVISRVINRARSILSDQGINTTNADIQATIWYPEKDIWAKLRGEDESNLKNSYDEEFLKLADERGLGEAARGALRDAALD